MEFWKNVLPLLEYLSGLAIVAVQIWPKKSSKKLRLAFSFLFITTTLIIFIIFFISVLRDTRKEELQIKVTATTQPNSRAQEKAVYVIQCPSGYSREAFVNSVMCAIQRISKWACEINTSSVLLKTEKHGNILICTANQLSPQLKWDSLYYLTFEEFCKRINDCKVEAVMPVTGQLPDANMVVIIR
jgi:hypothetical protein